MTDDQLETLKKAALAATPQDLDSAEIKREGGWCDCPTCGGEGSVEIETDYCNYDGKALGVQFYGIGPEHLAAEAYFRAASPAAILALIERVERAEAMQARALTIDKVQQKALDCGFQYWRASDAHGVVATNAQAVDLLQNLLGVEVEISDRTKEKTNE